MRKKIIYLSIILILCILLGFFIKNRFFNDHGKKKLIEEYNIHCENGTHLDSEYHKPKWNQKMVSNDDFYTLDIFCVDDNGIKNGVFYKFQGSLLILRKGEYLNGEMEGEWEFDIYYGFAHNKTYYKNGKRNGVATGYNINGTLGYTGLYIDDKQVGQWTFYNSNGSISTIRIYSGYNLIERKEFYEDGKIKHECLNGGGCMDYDENGKITRKTPNNYRDYSGEEFRTYPNGKLEKVANYIDGKRDGRYIEYYENGKISYQCNYNLGKEDRCVSYDENGEVKHETRYYKGTACSKKVYDDWMGKDLGNGLFTGYYEDGQISYICNYISGQEEGRCVHYKRNGEIEDEGWHHKGYVYSKVRYESIIEQEN